MKKILFANPFKEVRYVRFKKNGVFWVFCVVLFTGIILGAVSGKNADNDVMERLDFIFRTNYHIRCSEGMVAGFISSFGTLVLFLTALFLMGLSLWGGLVCWTVPFFKGYGYGLSVGYLYSAYGFYGVGYNLLMILPGMFLSAFILSAAAAEVLKNSVKMTKLFVRSAVKDDPPMQLAEYVQKMMFFLLLCALASVADTLMALCFSWIFKF